jgi:hypothetical protein
MIKKFRSRRAASRAAQQLTAIYGWRPQVPLS